MPLSTWGMTTQSPLSLSRLALLVSATNLPATTESSVTHPIVSRGGEACIRGDVDGYAPTISFSKATITVPVLSGRCEVAVQRNFDRDTCGSALQVAKAAFPIVSGTNEVSRGGHFEGETIASARMEAPFASPLAPGFIEVSVRWDLNLRAGPADIAVSAVACPFIARKFRKMRMFRNLDCCAGFSHLSVAAVALPPLPAEREKCVLGHFDIHTQFLVRESVPAVAFPAGSEVLDVSMVGYGSRRFFLCRRGSRPSKKQARGEPKCPHPAPFSCGARPRIAIPTDLHRDTRFRSVDTWLV